MHLTPSQTERLGTDDRTSKGVFWRAPSQFQLRFRATAKSLDISQNALLTTAAIFGELVLLRPPEGEPENLLRLVDAMNAATSGSDSLVMDACHRNDWKELQLFIDVLQDANVIGGVRQETRDFAPDMILYALTLTPDGVDIWRRLAPVIRLVIAAGHEDDAKRMVKRSPRAQAGSQHRA